MRVLHVIPTLASEYGGPVTAVLGMTAALRKSGAEVRILATDYLMNGNGAETTDGVRVFPCQFEPWRWSPALGSALPNEVAWADIVNIHTLWTYPVLATARACWSAGVPYILRPAGMLDQWSVSEKKFKKQIYKSLVENKVINCAAGLWFTSKEERAGAAAANYRARNSVIPLGIATDQYVTLPQKGLFRERFLGSSTKRIVLFLGRIAAKKQPDVLMKAFSNMARDFDDAILVIAGPDEGGFLARVKELAEVLKITERVYFTGGLKKEDVVAALNDAEVFVLPSLHENFGVSVIEAMAAATPVIVSDKVGLAGFVKDAEAGLVIEPAQADLKSSLEYLLSNCEAAREMGRRGREMVWEKFTWERIVPAITGLYEGAVGRNRKVAAALS